MQAMSLIVQKYGGTSVGSLDRIERVAERVISARMAGHQVVVVVSAMSGETNRLIDMARTLSNKPPAREYSSLVATGEQQSMALLCIALAARDCPASSLTGQQAGIATEQRHKNARIVNIEVDRIRQLLDDGQVVVVAGFQGANDLGDITTLGRGGSDTSGVALAAALTADECQIYTDVDGVYTADPRVVPEARRLSTINFEEMLELASLGSKVIQRRAVEMAGRYQVPLRVLSSFDEGEGTLINFNGGSMEYPVVSGIAFNRSEAKLTIVGVPDTPGVASKILGSVSAANIDIDMIIQNIAADSTTDFTFTVHRDDYDEAKAILERTANELGAREVKGDNKIAKISLVGMGMRSHTGVADTMFSTLGQEAINIQMISTSEIKISVVVAEKYLELGVRALHSAFGLEQAAREEFDPKQG